MDEADDWNSAATQLKGSTTRFSSAALYAAVALVIFTSASRAQEMAARAPASTSASGGTVWLDQGWSDGQRSRHHHQSQGTLTLPIESSWFLALQQAEDLSATAGRVSDPSYLARFGFIASPAGPLNPDGLPIGFARTTGTDPRTGKRFDRIGFTCAACHTGRIDTGASTILIDGGPAMIDITGFGTKLALAMGETALSPVRFHRFASRVLGDGASLAQRLALHRQLSAAIAEGLGDLLQGPTGNVTEGFGRLDALNRIGNTVFGSGMGIARNRVATTAPVAYPHLWDASWFSWVQYNGSIERPMVRNAGEAMGVGAVVNYKDGPTPRFTSTIPAGLLYDPIETSMAGGTPPLPVGSFSGLRAPAWPEALLGQIDRQAAARGADLYRAHCQGCHLPPAGSQEFWTSARWTPANAAGERYLDLLMIDIDKIGTDPAQAEDMKKRIVLAPAELGLPGAIGSDGTLRRYPYGPALGQVVQRVVERWYDSQRPPVPAADRERMNGNRANGIRDPLAYKARPLDGIWATPPFLHNGSVPTIWHLLSPYRERPARFSLGSTRYDAEKLGYVNAGPFTLDTTRRGNRNTGHLFDSSAPSLPGTLGPELKPEERHDLIEFLKTL